MIRRFIRARPGALALAVVLTAACEDSPTLPPFQVITEVEFHPSLNIDLSTMQVVGSGVYIKDLVEGSGDPAIFGKLLDTNYQGFLVDGTKFVETHHEFQMGNDRVPPGLEDGLLNMLTGGTRQIIVPPEQGYGGLEQIGNTGVTIPGGSILVYVVTLNGVSEGPS
jgi:FKBP-type peptidyl-prolyl cis-trans isomerase FkpA